MNRHKITSILQNLYLSLFVSFFLSACDESSGERSAADTVMPTVSSTSPANAAADVARNSTITVIFDEDMLATTIDASSFTLTSPRSGNIPGIVTFDSINNVARFTPDSDLASLTTYTATLSTAITDLSGNALATNYIWSFTTIVDTTVPTVSDTSPGNDATAVVRNSTISAVFDKGMLATTIDASSFTLTSLRSGNIPGIVTFDNINNVARFTPNSDLASLTTYTATLSTAITDLSGNTLAASYSWSFSTTGGTWGRSVLVESNDAGSALSPQVAFDDSGNALAVWRQHDGSRYNIWANWFDGASWANATLIESDDAGTAYSPQIAFDNSGNALAVWSQSDGIRFNIWASWFDGTSWGRAVLVESNDAGSALSPQVAFDDSGNALAVWRQHDGSRYNIWANWFDGASWANATLIESDDAGTAYSPQIAFDNSGNALAVWSQSDGIRLNIWASWFDGTNWGSPVLLENDDIGDAVGPKITFDNSGNAFVVWKRDDGNRDSVWVDRFDGASWVGAERIDNYNTGIIFSPQIALDNNGNSLVVWALYNGSRTNIWVNRFDGTSWGNAAVLIESDNAGLNPQVAFDNNGNALVVWQKYSGDDGSNIWANQFDGTTWAGAKQINNAEEAYSPKIAFDGSGKALAVWQQSDGSPFNIWANRFE